MLLCCMRFKTVLLYGNIHLTLHCKVCANLILNITMQCYVTITFAEI